MGGGIGVGLGIGGKSMEQWSDDERPPGAMVTLDSSPSRSDAEWFRTLAESAWFGVFVYRGNRFYYVNRASARITGYDQAALLRMGPEDLIHPDSQASLPAIDSRSGLYPTTADPVEARIVCRDGGTRWIALTTGTVEFSGFRAGLGTAVDITLQKTAQAELARSLEVQNVLTEISQRFLRLDPSRLDEGIAAVLGLLGRTAAVDRCSLFRLTEDRREARCTHDWCRDGVDSLRQAGRTVPADVFPQFQRRLQEHEIVTIASLDDLPDESGGERRWLEEWGVRSFAVVPFHLGGELAGFVTFGAVEGSRRWGDEETQLLRVGGEVIGAALYRLRSEIELRDSRERLELAQIAGRSVAWEWDLQSDRMVFSTSASHVFGIAPERVPGSGAELRLMVPPEDRERISQRFREIFRTGEPYVLEHRITMPGGQLRWISARGQPERDDLGRVRRIVGVSADVTERIEAELALRQEKERALVTLSSIGDGVIRTDPEGRVDFLNPAAERLTGRRTREALGRPLSEVYRVADESTGRLRPDPVSQCLEAGRVVESTGPAVLLREDGSEFAVRDSAAPISGPDGRPVGAVLVVQDVTRVRRLEREMAYLATRDPLTGLINRREFERRLQEAIREASFAGQSHCLCYLDLDDFKVLNDTCGHVAGDELLRQLTGVLAASIPAEDTIGRLGGDEFGILLRNCTLEEGRGSAEAVLDAVRGFRFLWQDTVYEVRASVGIVSIGRERGSLPELLSAADAACYVAKDRGRNRVHVSEPDDAEIALRYTEMGWIQRINAALDEGRFVLYGQPIRPLRERRAEEFVEVLLRLVDESGEIIAPEQFLTAAERYRIMPSVDRWVVRQALAVIAEDRTATTFAINLSGQSFGDAGLLDLIVERLDHHRIDGRRVCFEITETTAISNLTIAQGFIDVLRERGCRFVLDDFGSGLSSFRYLRSLPVSLLKIDGEIVRHVAQDPIQREMVTAIRRIGETMGLRTIGEWVESRAVAETLRDIGVDYAQGFWVARPRPLVGALDPWPDAAPRQS